KTLIQTESMGGCELMIAYYFQGKPQLYTIDLVFGMASKANGHFATIGCARTLGDYMLTEHVTPEMTLDFASIITLFTIETVKRHDAACGGPVRLAAVIPSPKFGKNSVYKETIDEEIISEICPKIMLCEETTRWERNRLLLESLYDIYDRKTKE